MHVMGPAHVSLHGNKTETIMCTGKLINMATHRICSAYNGPSADVFTQEQNRNCHMHRSNVSQRPQKIKAMSK